MVRCQEIKPLVFVFLSSCLDVRELGQTYEGCVVRQWTGAVAMKTGTLRDTLILGKTK